MGLREGDENAARELWDRYSARIMRLAARKLGGYCKRVADEEDVALSVFRRLYQEVEDGGFPELEDRGGLWNLLIVLTSNRVVDQKRHFATGKRGGGNVRGDSVFLNRLSSGSARGFDGQAGTDVPPSMLLELAEAHDQLMSRLDEQLAQIARWKLEEQDNTEIAERLGITPRSVRRKLERIREIWICLSE